MNLPEKRFISPINKKTTTVSNPLKFHRSSIICDEARQWFWCLLQEFKLEQLIEKHLDFSLKMVKSAAEYLLDFTV